MYPLFATCVLIISAAAFFFSAFLYDRGNEIAGFFLFWPSIGFFLFGLWLKWDAWFQAYRAVNLVKKQPPAPHSDAHLRAQIIHKVEMIEGGAPIRKAPVSRNASLGCLISGPLGILAGILTALAAPVSCGHKQRFLVYYDDGHTEIVDAAPNSRTYKKLIKFVK